MVDLFYKDILQISERKFFKNNPFKILVLVFVVTLVVSAWLKSPKNGRKSSLKMKGVSKLGREKSEFRSFKAFQKRIRLFPYLISMPPLIFKLDFLPFFGL